MFSPLFWIAGGCPVRELLPEKTGGPAHYHDCNLFFS